MFAGVVKYIIVIIGSRFTEIFVHDIWIIGFNHSTCHTAVIWAVRVVRRINVKHSIIIIIRFTSDFFSIHMLCCNTNTLRLSSRCNSDCCDQDNAIFCKFIVKRHDTCPPFSYNCVKDLVKINSG